MKFIPDELKAIAKDFGVDVRDVLTMHLNLNGLSNVDLDDRLRMFLTFPGSNDRYFLILSTNRTASPYSIEGDAIYHDSTPLLRVSDVRPDLALTGYRRHAGKAVTLNTNFRTGCTGCVFCPNTFAGSISQAPQPTSSLSAELDLMDKSMGKPDWAKIEDIVVSTGCFRSAGEAINHMEQIQTWARDKGFHGSLGILSTELIEPDDLLELKSRIPHPRIIFTLECFERRELLLRESKSRVTPEEILNAVRIANELRIATGLTYLLGLDSLSVVEKELPRFFPFLTTFPNIQVYQAHNSVMEATRVEGSKDLSYYMKARKELGARLAAAGLEPEPWRNYRSPWLFEFEGKELSPSLR